MTASTICRKKISSQLSVGVSAAQVASTSVAVSLPTAQQWDPPTHPSNNGELGFTGAGGDIECQVFINSIRQHALAVGKSRDPNWMADFAASRFWYGAFSWYNNLPQRTRGNWDSLVNALCEEYMSSAANQLRLRASISIVSTPTPAEPSGSPKRCWRR